MAGSDSIKFLSQKIKDFCDERDWGKFHTPKNTAIAINVEAAELLELFQWTESPRVPEKVAKEAADILYMLLLFCSVNKINVGAVLLKKMADNAQKYPVEKVKGSPKKYDQY